MRLAIVGSVALLTACSPQSPSEQAETSSADMAAGQEAEEAPTLASVNDLLVGGDTNVCGDDRVVGAVLNGLKERTVKSGAFVSPERASSVIEAEGYKLTMISASDYRPEISEMQCEALFSTNNPAKPKELSLTYLLRPESGSDNFLWEAGLNPFSSVVAEGTSDDERRAWASERLNR